MGHCCSSSSEADSSSAKSTTLTKKKIPSFYFADRMSPEQVQQRLANYSTRGGTNDCDFFGEEDEDQDDTQFRFISVLRCISEEDKQKLKKDQIFTGEAQCALTILFRCDEFPNELNDKKHLFQEISSTCSSSWADHLKLMEQNEKCNWPGFYNHCQDELFIKDQGEEKQKQYLNKLLRGKSFLFMNTAAKEIIFNNNKQNIMRVYDVVASEIIAVWRSRFLKKFGEKKQTLGRDGDADDNNEPSSSSSSEHPGVLLVPQSRKISMEDLALKKLKPAFLNKENVIFFIGAGISSGLTVTGEVMERTVQQKRGMAVDPYVTKLLKCKWAEDDADCTEEDEEIRNFQETMRQAQAIWGTKFEPSRAHRVIFELAERNGCPIITTNGDSCLLVCGIDNLRPDAMMGRIKSCEDFPFKLMVLVGVGADHTSFFRHLRSIPGIDCEIVSVNASDVVRTPRPTLHFPADDDDDADDEKKVRRSRCFLVQEDAQTAIGRIGDLLL